MNTKAGILVKTASPSNTPDAGPSQKKFFRFEK